MPVISPFCPCCGAQPRYSIELAHQILGIVCEYMQLDARLVKSRKLCHDDGEGRARGFTLYFLRAITGESYKRIGEIFNLKQYSAGAKAIRIEEQLEDNIAYRIQFFEIAKRLQSEDLILSQPNFDDINQMKKQTLFYGMAKK